jgi:glycosyltransferase involved in cell wall biosynthesis
VRIFKRPEKPWTLKNILKTCLGLYPFLLIRNLSEEEKKAIKEELEKEKFDLIHAENFYAMPHLPKTMVPVLLTEQTVFYRVYQLFVDSLPWYLFFLRPILLIDVLKLKYWESKYWKTVDHLAVVSEEDSARIKQLTKRKSVYIVPNGVDFQNFSQKRYNKNRFPTILFGAADFHWMENKEGAAILIREIWPIIKKKVKNAKLWVVGKIAPQALSSYTSLNDVIIEEIGDSREAYQKSWVLVAPMRSGGGSRTKFFEAMASGLPIVTTSKGMEGIRAENRKEIFFSDDLGEIAKSAIELLEDRKMAERVGKRAKELVKKNYGWEKSAKRLDRVYQEIGLSEKS